MASSLTIAPSLGHSVVSAQGMPGGYDAIDDRAFWGIGLQEGTVEAGAYKVTQRAAGANMTVDVAVDDGHVVVEGDSVTNQGLYVVRAHPSVANLDIAAADGTNPRNDIVVVQVDDDEHDSGGNTRGRVMVLTGTPNASATIADDPSENGTPDLPDSAMLLAVVNVPASDTAISDSQIRDRRKWARGAFRQLTQETAYSTTSTSLVEIDATNLKPRIECSGAPLRLVLAGVFANGVQGNQINLQPFVDGAAVSPTLRRRFFAPNNGYDVVVHCEWIITPAAGSHLLSPAWFVNAGTGSTSATYPTTWTVEELVRQNASND